MAARRGARSQEVELLQGGTETRSAEKVGWVQNMWRPFGRREWEVRPGWGQAAEHDTTASMRLPVGTDWGYREHLGSTLIETSFGTEQVVSVHLMRGFSGEIASKGTYAEFYSVSIVDLDTGGRWEELIHQPTSDNNVDSMPLDEWHANYETNEDEDHEQWIAGSTDRFYFATFEGVLYLGNRRTGVMVYRPTDFRRSRRRQVETAQKESWSKQYGESSLLTRLTPVNGLVSDAFAYLNRSTFPEVLAISDYQGRLVVASEREVFFSDPSYAASFAASNSFSVPSEKPITAIASIADSLMIWTESETFYYQPSSGFVVSTGRIVKVSDHVGCIGGHAVSRQGTGVIWVDRNGVWSSNNGLQINDASAPIRGFFNDQVTSPLNAFFVNNGLSSPATEEQPRTSYSFDSRSDVSIAHNSRYGVTLVSFSEMNVLWCFDGQNWSLWPVESMVSTHAGQSIVGVKRGLTNPAVLSGKEDFYLVGGIQEQTLVDASPVGLNTVASSYYITTLERGGGLDRSIKDEDERIISGYYEKPFTGASDARFYFGEPIVQRNGERWIPVDLVTDSVGASLPTHFDLIFTFDTANWDIALVGGSTIDLVTPTERNQSIGGYSLVAPVVGTSEAQVYLGGAPNAIGNEIRIRWNAAQSLAHVPAGPGALQLTPLNRNPMFYLKFIPVGAVVPTTINWGFTFSTAQVLNAVPVTDLASVYVWEQAFRSIPNTLSAESQPVDWAFKGTQIGLEQGGQVKARGVYALMKSRGRSTSPIFPGWLWGVYNTLLGSDWKGWSSQVVDTTENMTDIKDKSSIRTRAKNASGNMIYRTFSGGPRYGSYLIDDEELDTIATSDSVRGEQISYMLFGFIRSRAEGLILSRAKAVIRRVGGRRRIGR
jgi:hypothetical protein